MPWWPGWDPVEWTGFWSTVYFWFGIGCLFLLGVSEVVSHYYGERHGTLLAQAEIRRAKAQKQEDARRDKESESLRQQLVEAQKSAADASEKVAKLQAHQADRRLSGAQKQAILSDIAPYPGQSVALVTPAGDQEAYQYAEDFLAVFKEAQWNISGFSQAVWTGGTVEGVIVTISKANGERNVAPIAAAHLMTVLIQLGIIQEAFNNSRISGDEVEVRIGRKPPPPPR